MKKNVLSSKQTAILKFIKQFIESKPYPPSIRDIKNGCGLSSTSVVDYNLKILEEKNYLKRDTSVSRGIYLQAQKHVSSLIETSDPDTTINQIELDDLEFENRGDSRTITIPFLGYIAAGEPLSIPPSDKWNSNEFDSVEIPAFLQKGNNDLFALKVKGDSMIDALVTEGDIIIMEQTTQAQPRDMVAAWLNDNEEVTLKYFQIKNDKVILRPANPTMSPIEIPANKVSIQGKIVGLIRSLS